MGPLTFPEHGPIYLDATSLIYSVERVEPFRTVLEPLWDQAKAGRYKLVTSELSVLETLVKPKRDGNSTLERLFRAAMFDATEIELIPATLSAWEEAVNIRAQWRLQTPDALHAATALLTGCTAFITNDADFRRVTGLPVLILSDLVGQAGL